VFHIVVRTEAFNDLMHAILALSFGRSTCGLIPKPGSKQAVPGGGRLDDSGWQSESSSLSVRSEVKLDWSSKSSSLSICLEIRED
jgi:hypothetical protein